MFYVYATDIEHKDFNRGLCLGRYATAMRAKQFARNIARDCDLVETMVMDSTDTMLWCSFPCNDTVKTA